MILVKKETWLVQTQIVFAMLILLAIFGSMSYQGSWAVRTPELFGEGTLYLLNINDRSIGFINAWGEWIIYGTKEDCRIVQISGDPIVDVTGPISCSMDFKDKIFKGSIDFRGHDRPFCGAISVDLIPVKCRK